MATKFNVQYLNPYEKSYNQLKNNPLFDTNDWDYLMNYRSQNDLDSYIDLMTASSSLNQDELINDLYFKEMDLDMKYLTLSNKLGKTNNVTKHKREIFERYNSLGEEVTTTVEMTDKEYYDYLINQWTARTKERKLLEEKQKAKENETDWEIWWNSVGATIGEFAIGAVETVENIVNFADATVDSLIELINPLADGKSNWDEALKTFRNELTDDETLPGFKEVAEDWHTSLMEWERDNTYFVDIDGNYTTLGTYVGGVAYSIGQQLPTWFLGPVGNVAFYGSILESNLQSNFRRFEDAPSIPTLQIVGEAAINTSLEYGVEKLLGKVFGATGSDLLRGIKGSGKVSTGIKRVLIDAAQEGLEETLQETTSWLSSNLAGLLYEEYRTDITFEQLATAAVSGALASLITGGFAETRRVMYDNKISKQIVKDDVNYKALSKEGVKETREQKKYRRTLLDMAKTKQAIDKAYDTTKETQRERINERKNPKEKPSLIKRFGVGLQSIINGYKEASDGIDVTTEKGRKTLAQLNLQLYTGYKTMMDMYGEFGKDQMVKAERLLQDLSKYSDAKTLTYTYRQKAFSDKLLSQVANIPTNKIKYDVEQLVKKVKDEEAKQSTTEKTDAKQSVKETTDKKSTKKDTDKKKSVSKNKSKIPDNVNIDEQGTKEIDAIMSADDSVLTDEEKSIKYTAKTLTEKYGNEIVLWDNFQIVNVNGTIFMPIQAIRNLKAKEILKSAAEKDLVYAFMSAIDQNVFDYFVKEFQDYVVDSTDPAAEMTYNLLFNPEFYNYLLNRADIRAFNVLKVLDNVLTTLANSMKSSELRTQYYEVVRRVRKTIGPSLALYFCNNPSAPIENVTVFNDAQLNFIKEHRVNYMVAERIRERTATEQDYNIIENIMRQKINDEDTIKDNMYAFRNGVSVESGLNMLDSFDGDLYGKYNDVIYLSDTSPGAAKFNTFLQSLGLTIKDVRNGDVTESVKLSMIKENGSFNKDDCLDYILKTFNDKTDGEYIATFDLLTNKISVTPNAVKNVLREEKSAYESTAVRDKYYATDYSTEGINNVKQVLSKNIAVSDVELTYTTFDDICNAPEKYLNDETLNVIRSMYKYVNKDTVFDYLNNLLVKNSNKTLGLTFTEKGKIVTVNLVNALKLLKKEYMVKINDQTDLRKSFGGNTYTLSDFIDEKYLPKELKNIPVIFSNDTNAKKGGETTLDKITIYVTGRTNASIMTILLHEYNHLVQNYNLMQVGFTSNFVVTNELIKDVKKYAPKSFKDMQARFPNYTDAEIVQRFIYENVHGEQTARGEFFTTAQMFPVLHTEVSGKHYLQLPWGKRYEVIYKGSSASKIREPKMLSLDDERKAGEITRTKLKGKQANIFTKVEDARKYRDNINKALELAKTKRINKEEMNKDDFKSFDLEPHIVKEIIDNTYKKSNDTKYEDARKFITAYSRKTAKEEHKKYFEEGKKSKRSRALFKKDAEGTNLMYWIDRYQNKVPEVAPEVQEFVVEADDLSQLPEELASKIKTAELTTRDIYNYIRETETMNDYTFNALKKSFFKNTPFTSFAQVQSFVELAVYAYALKAALLTQDEDHYHDYVYGELKWNLDKYKDRFDKLLLNENVVDKDKKTSETAKNIAENAQKALSRFSTFWYKDKEGKKRRGDIDIDDASSDIVLGLLKYFDNTINSLAYIAGNAKYALQRSVINDTPFTYKQKKDISGHVVISIDAPLENEKEGESDNTVGSIISETGIVRTDERNALRDAINSATEIIDGRTSDENKQELLKLCQEFVETNIIYNPTFKKYSKEERIDKAMKLYKHMRKDVNTLSSENLNKRLLLIMILTDAGIPFEDAFGLKRTERTTEMEKRIEDAMLSITNPETTVEIYTGLSQQNEYRKLKRKIDRLADRHMNALVYSHLSNEQKRFFDKDNHYKFNKKLTEGMTGDQIAELAKEFDELAKGIRAGEYASVAAKRAAKKAKKEIAKRDKEIAELKEKLSGKAPTTEGHTYNINETDSLQSNKPVPKILKTLLDTTFYKYRQSTAKFGRLENETQIRTNADEFFSQHAETLEHLTERDVLEILDYFETAKITNSDYVPYDTFRLYLLAFFIEQITLNNFKLDATVKDRCQAMFDAIRTNAARNLGTIQGLLSMINPTKRIMAALARSSGLEFTEDELEPLTKTLKSIAANNHNITDPVLFKEYVNKLNQEMDNLKKLAKEKYGKKSKKNTGILFDKILKFQKAMMLSNPATAIRNGLSNLLLGGFDIKGKHIWGINELADWIGGIFKPKGGKTYDQQYDFSKVVISDNTKNFILDFVVNSGLLDAVSDGLNKYDTRTRKANSKKIEDQLTQMIVQATTSNMLNENMYNTKALNTVTNIIFKAQSDNKAIQRSVIRYLGKILESDKIDLTKGMSEKVMQSIAQAYKLAAWDYMHKTNFISDIEYTLRTKNPSVYFAFKTVIPFASSTWNWFLEFLKLNPVAMVANIVKLNKLERVINNMSEKRRLGDTYVPDSRFAQMLVKRDIGKGVIGTVLMILGAALGAFGVIKLDDDDEKLKIQIGNTWLDVSSIFGTSSILVGAALTQPSEGSFWTVFENALNLQFEDFILTQVMNNFKYDNSIVDYLSSLPTTIASTFVPNIYKAVVKTTNNHKVKYSSGILGSLEYFAIQTIPFIEYALPKSIDPYTGEWEYKYSVPAIHQLINIVSPINVKTYDISPIEQVFIDLGMNKKMLTGEYKDLMELGVKRLDTTTLNEFYGKLNNDRLTKFIHNKIKYEIKDDKNRTKSLYFNQMTNEQKESVLNRITTQNANYAKIFTWINSGHKYYCSQEKRSELAKLGITKNIYIGNKGFVK